MFINQNPILLYEELWVYNEHVYKGNQNLDKFNKIYKNILDTFNVLFVI